jgi:hypothetical protein
MAPHSGAKKKVQDQPVEVPNPNFYMFLDTTVGLRGSIKSWAHVYKILEEEKSIVFYDESKEEDVINIDKLKKVSKSELHKVATRPQLLP